MARWTKYAGDCKRPTEADCLDARQSSCRDRTDVGVAVRMHRGNDGFIGNSNVVPGICVATDQERWKLLESLNRETLVRCIPVIAAGHRADWINS
jgi:hypothetical protein